MEQNFSVEISTTSAFTLAEPRFDPLVGFISAFVACVFFGTYFIPVKKFDAGDGVFFQWVQCCAIMVFGIVFNMIIGSPKFEPLAMVGGVMWCSGNLVCVIAVRCIGLAMGQNMWALICMLLGWASGRFGWFGPASIPSIAWLQYLGIALAVIRGVLAAFITPSSNLSSANEQQERSRIVPGQNQRKPTAAIAVCAADSDITLNKYSRTGSHNLNKSSSEYYSQTTYSSFNKSDAALGKLAFVSDALKYDTNSAASSSSVVSIEPQTEFQLQKSDFIDSLSPAQKRLVGVSLSIFTGATLGLQFAPVSVLKAQGGSPYDMDYSFALYCGTFLSSSVYMVIYALAKRNRPFVNKKLIAPAFLSGLMWVIAQTSWLFANEALSQAITFPIISAGPALICLGLGYFVFKEIQGLRNTILLLLVAIVTVASVLMVAFSM